MSTGTIVGWATGTRKCSIVEREPVVIHQVREAKRPDLWCVQPSGLPCQIYVASREDAEACLRGVVEGLR